MYILFVLIFLLVSMGFSPQDLAFDRQLKELMLRILSCLLLAALLLLYKYCHGLFFKRPNQKMPQKFYPSVNSADTVHYFSRILGFSIIFSSVQVYLYEGTLWTTAFLTLRAFVIFLIYFTSLAIGEGIAFSQFSYADEISKRKNLSYGVVHLAQTIALAFVTRKVIIVAEFFLPTEEFFIWLFFLWLYSSVVFGMAAKLFSRYSKLPFDELIRKKNMAVALSYSGYILGSALLINSSLLKKSPEIGQYLQKVGLKTLLIILILPLFIICIKKIFLFQDHSRISGEYEFDLQNPEVGYGIYEGCLFLAASLLTVVVIDQIFFGPFSPFLSYP